MIETKDKSFAKRCQFCSRAIIQLCNRTRFFGLVGEVPRFFMKTYIRCVSLQTRKRRFFSQFVRLMQLSQISKKRCRKQRYCLIRKSYQHQLRRICRISAFLRLLEISRNCKTVEMTHHCFSTFAAHSALPSYHQISNFFPYFHNFLRAIFLQSDKRRKSHSINSLRYIGKSDKLFKNIVQLRHLLCQQTVDRFFGNADQLCLRRYHSSSSLTFKLLPLRTFPQHSWPIQQRTFLFLTMPSCHHHSPYKQKTI